MKTEETTIGIISESKKNPKAGVEIGPTEDMSRGQNVLQDNPFEYAADDQPDRDQVIREFKSDLKKVGNAIKLGGGQARKFSKRFVKQIKTATIISGRIITTSHRIASEAADKAKTEYGHIATDIRRQAQVQDAIDILRQQGDLIELYLGKVRLEVVSPTDYGGLMNFKKNLGQIPELTVKGVGGSAAGMEITVSIETPTSLIDLLEGMPMVDKVAKGRNGIYVALKANG